MYKKIFTSHDKENLQRDLTKLKSSADGWLIKLNTVKCKKTLFGKHIISTDHYNINNTELENVESIKDLGVTFDSHLKFGLHINEKLIKHSWYCKKKFYISC